MNDGTMLTEFSKLCNLLKGNGIIFEVEDLPAGKRLCIPDKQHFQVRVICCKGSWGYERGLLEMWAPSTWRDVDGYLTAEKAFEWIREVVRKEKAKKDETITE